MSKSFLIKKTQRFISAIVVIFSEFTMPPVVWHKVRSVVMTMAMKTISTAIDKTNRNDLPTVYTYMGYTFCGATCLFGPWMSLKDYLSIRYINNKVKSIGTNTIHYINLSLTKVLFNYRISAGFSMLFSIHFCPSSF